MVDIKKAVVLIFLILLLAISTYAEVPPRMNIQGRVVNATTLKPLNGTYTMTFKIYDFMSELLWTNVSKVNLSKSGLYDVILEGEGQAGNGKCGN